MRAGAQWPAKHFPKERDERVESSSWLATPHPALFRSQLAQTCFRREGVETPLDVCRIKEAPVGAHHCRLHRRAKFQGQPPAAAITYPFQYLRVQARFD